MSTDAIPASVRERILRHYVPEPPSPWLADPAGWVKAKTREHLWSKQVELLSALVDHRKVAVKAGHGVGKTMSAARAVCWWVDAHPVGTTRVVTTAPSDYQVKGLLWQEIRQAHQKANLSGHITMDARWTDNGREVGIGRKPPDQDAEDQFQGIHDRFVLAVLDEAGGIPRSIWNGVDTLLTNDDARALAIGNPTNPSSEFADICAGAPEDGTSGMSDLGWWVITISVFDSPNFTDEPLPDDLRPMLTGSLWVEERRAKWTEASPLWIARVLGRFPTDATDGVVPYSFVARCRVLEPTGATEPRHLGVDPARDGEDQAVAWLRVGNRAVRKWSWPYTPDPLRLAELVKAIIVEHDVDVVKIDADGLGWGMSGILDKMHQDGEHEARSIPVYGSKNDIAPAKFKNNRAAIWWAARERSRLGEWDLGALDDDDVAELTATRYFVNPSGKTQIEKKEETKKRIGKSPDSADALNLAFHEVSFVGVNSVADMASMRAY